MRLFFISCFFLLFSVLHSQNLTQTIRGRVSDAVLKSDLPGVQVLVFKDSLKTGYAQTDAQGVYRLPDVPIGRITVKANFLGYHPVVFTIEVTSAKEVILNFEMEESVVNVEEVTITAVKKGEVRNEMAAVSAKTFSVEETNRYAGSRSDPARMASNFAGVQGSDDSRNDIVIRGNSPFGLLWRLEGVDIPSPNHFSAPGTTGGPINIINSKTLANSEFYTGAFPAEYGNCNSGIFDLRMRNGNNEQHEFTGQFGFLGTELAGEGPLSKRTGSSYLFSYRYSTLKLFDALNIHIGTSAVPQYQDAAFKINLPGKDGSTISLFGIGGKSKIDILVSTQTEPEKEIYGDKDRDQLFGTSMGVAGVSYTKPLNDKTYMKLVLAHSGNESHTNHILVFRDTNYQLDSLVPNMAFRYIEQKSSANFFINRKFTTKISMKAGFFINYYNFNLLDSNLNTKTYRFIVRNKYKGGTSLIQSFAQFRIMPSDKFVITAGLHAQYFAINSNSSIEPRAGAKWNFSKNQSFNFGLGMHSQMQPTYVYFTHAIDPKGTYIWHNKNIGFTRSIHNVIGYDLSPSQNLHIKAEVYYQYLYQVPIDIYSSSFSLLNQGSGFNRIFPDTLTNKGTGKNYGIELTAEKFFSKDFFFMITASVYDSKYTGSDGVERNTDFNGNFGLNGLLAKEYKIGRNKNSVLTTGTKITYAGGTRYTPADTAASAMESALVGIDSLRNSRQFKNYFRWDIKIGFRANRKKITHEIGLDLINILNTKNVLGLIYSPNVKNPTDVIRQEYQLGFLPLFYYRIDF